MADYNNEEKKIKEKNLGQFADKAVENIEKAEKIKKWVTRIIAASKVIGIGMVIGGILALTTFLASALDYLDWDTYTKAISVKANAIGEEALEKNILVIEDGKYKISYDGKTGKEAIEAILEDNNMNFEDFTDEEIECLYKALKAEWATTYPNLGEDVDNEDIDSEYVQGVITIKRGKQDGTVIPLEYEAYEDFSQREDETALDYFSIKDGNIIVAGWSTNQVIFEPSESMPEDIKSQYVSTEEQISIQEVSINYRSIIGIHTMPFDFLAALLVNTEDVDFVDELADLAFNSTIEATIYDNTTQITTIETEHINEETTYQKWVDYYTTNTTETFLADGTLSRGSSSNSNTTYNEEITSTEKKEIDYTLTTTRITKNNSYTFGLTNVSSWIADITNEYTYSPEYGQEENLALGGPNTSNYEGEIQEISVEDSDVVAFKDSKYSTSSTVDSYNNSTITQTITCTITAARKQETSKKTIEVLKNSSTTDEYKYEKGTVETVNIGEKFKEVYDNNSKAQAQLEVVSSWLFELLEESSSTIDYVSVMKYLLYVCTGQSYGVTDLDELFLDNSFNMLSNASGTLIEAGSIEATVWYTLKSYGFSDYVIAGIMGNIVGESSFNPTLIENEEEPETSGIGLCQWSFDRNAELRTYAASKGTEWTDVETQIEFLIAEITNPQQGPAKDYARYQFIETTEEGVEYTQESWLSSEDVEYATKAFTFGWERPNKDHPNFKTNLQRKIAAAEEFYAQFSGTTAPITVTGGSNNSTGSASIDAFLAKADEIHAYMEKNYFTYGHSSNPKSAGQANCVSYVTWALKEIGYIDSIYVSCREFYNAHKNNFVMVNSANDLQAGDIVFQMTSSDSSGCAVFQGTGRYISHVQIYAGDNTWYNAGSTSAIQRNSPYYYVYSESMFSGAFRLK